MGLGVGLGLGLGLILLLLVGSIFVARACCPDTSAPCSGCAAGGGATDLNSKGAGWGPDPTAAGGKFPDGTGPGAAAGGRRGYLAGEAAAAAGSGLGAAGAAGGPGGYYGSGAPGVYGEPLSDKAYVDGAGAPAGGLRNYKSAAGGAGETLASGAAAAGAGAADLYGPLGAAEPAGGQGQGAGAPWFFGLFGGTRKGGDGSQGAATPAAVVFLSAVATGMGSPSLGASAPGAAGGLGLYGLAGSPRAADLGSDPGGVIMVAGSDGDTNSGAGAERAAFLGSIIGCLGGGGGGRTGGGYGQDPRLAAPAGVAVILGGGNGAFLGAGGYRNRRASAPPIGPGPTTNANAGGGWGGAGHQAGAGSAAAGFGAEGAAAELLGSIFGFFTGGRSGGRNGGRGGLAVDSNVGNDGRVGYFDGFGVEGAAAELLVEAATLAGGGTMTTAGFAGMGGGGRRNFRAGKGTLGEPAAAGGPGAGAGAGGAGLGSGQGGKFNAAYGAGGLLGVVGGASAAAGTANLYGPLGAAYGVASAGQGSTAAAAPAAAAALLPLLLPRYAFFGESALAPRAATAAAGGPRVFACGEGSTPVESVWQQQQQKRRGSALQRESERRLLHRVNVDTLEGLLEAARALQVHCLLT